MGRKIARDKKKKRDKKQKQKREGNKSKFKINNFFFCLTLKSFNLF